MMLRWTKRLAWLGFLLVLIAVPARLGNPPELAQAAAPERAPEAVSLSPAGWLIVALTLLLAMGWYLVRARRA